MKRVLLLASALLVSACVYDPTVGAYGPPGPVYAGGPVYPAYGYVAPPVVIGGVVVGGGGYHGCCWHGPVYGGPVYHGGFVGPHGAVVVGPHGAVVAGPHGNVVVAHNGNAHNSNDWHH